MKCFRTMRCGPACSVILCIITGRYCNVYLLAASLLTVATAAVFITIQLLTVKRAGSRRIDPEVGKSTLLRNAIKYLPIDTSWNVRLLKYSYWKFFLFCALPGSHLGFCSVLTLWNFWVVGSAVEVWLTETNWCALYIPVLWLCLQ
jgi:hypothetical protein